MPPHKKPPHRRKAQQVPTLPLGTTATYSVTRLAEIGAFLDVEGYEVLLPKKFVEPQTEPGSQVRAFLYTDSEDRPVATTQLPLVQLNEFSVLKVKQMTAHGAFMDWGLDKDLFVPYKEMNERMEEGKRYVVRLCLDHRSNRLMGTTKVGSFLEQAPADALAYNQEVELLVLTRHERGFRVIVAQKYPGLLYGNELFANVRVGDVKRGYVKKVREDGKVDCSLRPQGFGVVDDAQAVILRALEIQGGFLALHDKSKPDEIKRILNMSKKTFKMAVGTLYKQRKIKISGVGIYINEDQ